VPCTLELRSPSNGTGTGETWAFSGRDERLLRDCLDQLDAFANEPPVRRDAWHKHCDVVGADGRWLAAMELWPDEPWRQGQPWLRPGRPDAAWTAEGARRLAEILPERLSDVATAIRARFSG